METSARPSGLRFSFPAKITSSILPERRLLLLCSPSTQRNASIRLDFPEPFGPTMAVMPPANSSDVGSANAFLRPSALHLRGPPARRDVRERTGARPLRLLSHR